jgi:hypothetical protein
MLGSWRCICVNLECLIIYFLYLRVDNIYKLTRLKLWRLQPLNVTPCRLVDATFVSEKPPSAIISLNDKIFAFLGRLAHVDWYLKMFRDNLPVPSSRVKRSKRTGLLYHWRWTPTGCPETSVTNYQSTLRSIAQERAYHLQFCLDF